ncbi:MAG: STAS domain-containing protein [Oscillibacter sp.]|nr:STAS domain-containing protein [Oscillibacter sp.]
MTISKKANGTSLEIAVSGRIDSVTAPELEAELSASLDGVEHLTLDFKEISYISSAGLRVLLSSQKRMNAQGDMKVTNVNEAVMEIFDVTGFSDILCIE